MNSSHQRFFIALLPPQEIQSYTKKIQQYFADHYNSRAAQKSPPHITLQPPFDWSREDIPILQQQLAEFASDRPSIPITLFGFAAFPPRVIFINVLKTPELLTLQTDLLTWTEEQLGIVDKQSKQRPFAPHMTVAFRDLSRQAFRTAWPEFEQRSLEFQFMASHLTLLMHNGQRWEIAHQFPFAC